MQHTYPELLRAQEATVVVVKLVEGLLQCYCATCTEAVTQLSEDLHARASTIVNASSRTQAYAIQAYLMPYRRRLLSQRPCLPSFVYLVHSRL